MRPAFSNALYYPSIDIRDTNWLKTAVLFWDSISTIVPESIRQPYKQPDTQYLFDLGFLRPLYVNSNDRSVVGIEEDVRDLLCTPEFMQSIIRPGDSGFYGGQSGRMSRRARMSSRDFSLMSIYVEKLSMVIRHEIRMFLHRLDDEEIYYFNGEFAYIYMTVLASKLCEDHSLGMVTDDGRCFDMGSVAKYGEQEPMRYKDYFLYKRPRDHQMEQGLLLDFVISGLSISPDTALADIISFKKRHKDELGRFRTQLSRLTQGLEMDKPMDILRQEISDLYKNDFMPAFNDFKAALTGSKIKWFTETFLKVSLLSASATGVPMALLGMPVEEALFAGMGMSVIASAVSYRVDKKRFLQENPYSYLLSINREL